MQTEFKLALEKCPNIQEQIDKLPAWFKTQIQKILKIKLSQSFPYQHMKGILFGLVKYFVVKIQSKQLYQNILEKVLSQLKILCQPKDLDEDEQSPKLDQQQNKDNMFLDSNYIKIQKILKSLQFQSIVDSIRDSIIQEQKPKQSENIQNIIIQQNKVSKKQKMIYKQPYFNPNDSIESLLHKPQCICPIKKIIKQSDNQNTFLCIHCQRYFHNVCMKKKQSIDNCPYCFLQMMNPLKKTNRPIYIGLLKKGVKRHTATFFGPQLSKNQKLMIRCIRLKEGAQQACLFPDAAQFTINNRYFKSFQPINKLSCLKYRKDQPFSLIKSDFFANQTNSLVIQEKIPLNRDKQVRYDAQNHIIALLTVEDIQIKQFIQNTIDQNTLGFQQSQIFFKNAFLINRQEQIYCELIKVPMICPISLTKIVIPARGVFCRHIQCFDMKNYLQIIKQSNNPRWKCPVCTSLAYELIVDPITMQILKKYKDVKLDKVHFKSNGQFLAIVEDSDHIVGNIKNLGIPSKAIKHSIPPRGQQKNSQPSKVFVLPEDVDIIEID